MTEPASATATPDSPGAMLRAAREKHGLHIAALAAAIKVAPRKLDALENDRWQELPDATFTRALAQTVCRTLKLDPRPILDRLPRPDAGSLEHVGGTLNMPFQDGGPREDGWLGRLRLGPLVVASAVLMLAALVLSFVPLPWGADGLLHAPPPTVLTPAHGADAVPAADAASDPVDGGALPDEAAQDDAVAAAAVDTTDTAGAPATPPVPPDGATPAATVSLARQEAMGVLVQAPPRPAPLATPGLLRLRASDASWVEVRDADERVLLSRMLQPGETVDLNGAPPLRLVVGNAGATEVLLRGQPLDLAPMARNNVVRTTVR